MFFLWSWLQRTHSFRQSGVCNETPKCTDFFQGIRFLHQPNISFSFLLIGVFCYGSHLPQLCSVVAKCKLGHFQQHSIGHSEHSNYNSYSLTENLQFYFVFCLTLTKISLLPISKELIAVYSINVTHKKNEPWNIFRTESY